MLTEDEFLDCTPRYFDALCKQHRGKVRHGELLFAQLTAAVVNFSLAAPKPPAKIEGFMLTPLKEVAVKLHSTESKQKIAAGVRKVMANWLR